MLGCNAREDFRGTYRSCKTPRMSQGSAVGPAQGGRLAGRHEVGGARAGSAPADAIDARGTARRVDRLPLSIAIHVCKTSSRRGGVLERAGRSFGRLVVSRAWPRGPAVSGCFRDLRLTERVHAT